MYKIGLKLKGFVCIDYILFPVRYMTYYPLQCYISMFVLIYRYLQLKKYDYMHVYGKTNNS